MPPTRNLAFRFITYAALLLSVMAIFIVLAHGHPVWAGKHFALGAIAVQCLQVAVIVVLNRYFMGRFAWLACILPCPAFLMSLCALALELQNSLPVANSIDAIELVTVAWLILVGALATWLSRVDNPWDDPVFANDFAMMSSCTAVIFVQFWLA
jgi:hypothetical protein